MKKYTLLFLLFLIPCCSLFAKSREFTVLQMNVWQEGTQVKGGFDAIADEIARLNPDIVMLCEIRNYNGKQFIPRLQKALEERGVSYNAVDHKGCDSNTLTKHKILEHYPMDVEDCSSAKTRIEIDGKQIVVYSCHLDYLNDATYMPRGYDANTWKKLDAPVTDVSQVEATMLNSHRGEGIRAVIEDAKKEKGNIIIIGGDFNEASHLDWNEQTKDLWDHHGTVIKWECSTALAENGYKDSYRVVHPNPITHPGFSFPADNEGAPLKSLAWGPDADERCRLDFIYYLPNKKLQVKNAIIVGPDRSIVRNERVKETTDDKFITPLNVWPTDHKAMLTTFKLKK